MTVSYTHLGILSGFDGTDVRRLAHQFTAGLGGSGESLSRGHAVPAHQFKFIGLLAMEVEGSTRVSTEGNRDLLLIAALERCV